MLNSEDIFLPLLSKIINLLPKINKMRYDITYKSDGSPVTKADYFMDDLIKDHLYKTFGQINIISEENKTNYSEKMEGYIAIVDPIDGTENFCSGLIEWGVAISIWKNEQHIGSLIFMPELNFYILTGHKINRIQSRITGLSSSMSDEFIPIIKKNQENRIMGCSVYNFYNIIRGSFKEFINPKGAYIWDLIAGAQLALENGCEVYIDGEVYDGRFLEPNKKYRVHIKNR